jgi:hypothetical protein
MKLLPVTIPKVQFTKTGLLFEDGMTVDEWASAWPVLEAMTDGLQWAIGDWLVHGERNNYGEKYAKQIEVTGYKYKSLANMAAICRSVPFSLRKENLSFGHHNLVSGMEAKEQKRWLDAAESNGWDVAALAEQINKSKGKPLVMAASKLFIPSKWVSSGVDWFRAQFERQPIEQWPQDRREMLKQDLAPIVRIYERL